MPTRAGILLIAFGIFLQGCSLQKRSLMPGWHVERIVMASTACDEPAVVGANHTAASEYSEKDAVSTAALQYPLIPMKALMAYSPSVQGVPELRTPHVPPQADSFEALPITNAGIAGQQVTRNAKAPGGLTAALLFLLSVVLVSGGSLFLLFGLAFGDLAVILVSTLALVVSGLLYFATRNPNAKWRRRAVDRYRERLLDRVDRSEERAEKEDELEAA